MAQKGPKKSSIRVQLPTEKRDAIVTLAAKRGMRTSTYVRSLLYQVIDRQAST